MRNEVIAGLTPHLLLREECEWPLNGRLTDAVTCFNTERCKGSARRSVADDAAVEVVRVGEVDGLPAKIAAAVALHETSARDIEAAGRVPRELSDVETERFIGRIVRAERAGRRARGERSGLGRETRAIERCASAVTGRCRGGSVVRSLHVVPVLETEDVADVRIDVSGEEQSVDHVGRAVRLSTRVVCVLTSDATR